MRILQSRLRDSRTCPPNRAAAARLRIASPSKVWTGFGTNAGGSLAMGLASMTGVVVQSAASVAGSMSSGFERAYASPHAGFTQGTIPAPSARGHAAAQGRGDTHIHVHLGGITVQGNVTAEDDLKLAIVRAVNTGIVEATRQRNRSMGVT